MHVCVYSIFLGTEVNMQTSEGSATRYLTKMPYVDLPRVVYLCLWNFQVGQLVMKCLNK